jgi:urease subunit gamma/beta
MRLTALEEDRILIFSAAELARRHAAAGLQLNQPEAVAMICDAILEAARAGGTYAQAVDAGMSAVAADDVLPGVADLIDDVRVEALFGDGTRLVVLHHPIPFKRDAGEGVGAMRLGSRPDRSAVPGLELQVANTSSRVVWVSSHYPFHLVNRRLRFDRARAEGHRLALPAGASERWGPGETKRVGLLPLHGTADSNPQTNRATP